MLVSLGKGPYPLGRFTIGRSLIVGLFPLADSSGLRISNMFDRESMLTITESVEESADSAVVGRFYYRFYCRSCENRPVGTGLKVE